MRVFKNIRLTENPFERLVVGEESRRPLRPQGGAEPKYKVTCIVLKAAVKTTDIIFHFATMNSVVHNLTPTIRGGQGRLSLSFLPQWVDKRVPSLHGDLNTGGLASDKPPDHGYLLMHLCAQWSRILGWAL
ncbi:hypothetical protein TNCV_3672641 [Trichonephila clavipes]|nr:hypothetical protein TNCV_3672641 [Trichonephila clavipes]